MGIVPNSFPPSITLTPLSLGASSKGCGAVCRTVHLPTLSESQSIDNRPCGNSLQVWIQLIKCRFHLTRLIRDMQLGLIRI
ncbi:hypothetical protein J6590_105341 [Homalodisca vitripennis]|nr:hypothetical protein J6590_105341 [Homalodisca vitripennis]